MRVLFLLLFVFLAGCTHMTPKTATVFDNGFTLRYAVETDEHFLQDHANKLCSEKFGKQTAIMTNRDYYDWEYVGSFSCR